MIKELIKVANHLDKLGLTKEADYLDRIIFKIAASDLFTRQIDNKTVKIDSILNNYITGNTVQDKPQAFKDWLLNPATINEKKTTYLFFENLPIWEDFGYNYFKGISLSANPVVFPFYSNLLKSLGANPTGDNNIDIIFYNLNKWAIGKNSAMKSEKLNVGDTVGNALSILNPIDAYNNLQNPAVAKETEKTFEELIDADNNSIYFPIAFFLGAPLMFGRGLTRLARGDYSGAANDIIFSAISTAAGHGVGKLFAGIPASSFGKRGGSEITKSFYSHGVALLGTGIIDQVRKSIENGILNDSSYNNDEKDKLITEVKKFSDEKIKEQLEAKLKEETVKKISTSQIS